MSRALAERWSRICVTVDNRSALAFRPADAFHTDSLTLYILLNNNLSTVTLCVSTRVELQHNVNCMQAY